MSSSNRPDRRFAVRPHGVGSVEHLYDDYARQEALSYVRPAVDHERLLCYGADRHPQDVLAGITNCMKGGTRWRRKAAKRKLFHTS